MGKSETIRAPAGICTKLRRNNAPVANAHHRDKFWSLEEESQLQSDKHHSSNSIKQPTAKKTRDKLKWQLYYSQNRFTILSIRLIFFTPGPIQAILFF